MAVLTLAAYSCTVEKTVVGNFNPEEKSVIYKKSHDFYFLWELVEGRRAEDYVTIKNYQKISKRSPFDAIWYVGSLGIVSPYTVVFRVNRDSEEAKNRPYKPKKKHKHNPHEHEHKTEQEAK